MKLKQYKLRSGKTEMTCWLEAGRVKKGDCFTLKDDEPAIESCMYNAPASSSAICDFLGVNVITIANGGK